MNRIRQKTINQQYMYRANITLIISEFRQFELGMSSIKKQKLMGSKQIPVEHQQVETKTC